MQAVAHCQLSSHKSQGITRSFRCQRTGTRQTGIYFNHPIIFRIRVQTILHVTLTHNPHMTNNFDGNLPQFMVLAVAQRLGRSNHNTFARMNTQRVKILHITYCDTVVIAVPYHLILNLFPSFQRLFHQYLGRIGKGAPRQFFQLLHVGTESRTQTA